MEHISKDIEKDNLLMQAVEIMSNISIEQVAGSGKDDMHNDIILGSVLLSGWMKKIKFKVDMTFKPLSVEAVGLSSSTTDVYPR